MRQPRGFPKMAGHQQEHRRLTRSSFLVLGAFAPVSALLLLRRDGRASATSVEATPGAGEGAVPGPAAVPHPAPAARPAKRVPPSVGPAGVPMPHGGPAGLVWSRPVFRDEFSGTHLDRTKWFPGWFGDGVLSGPVITSGYETAAYATDHISVAGGKLHLKVGPNRQHRAVRGVTYPNLGAQITSDPFQGAKPGYLSPGRDYYIETYARMPPVIAGARAVAQPSFWQDPHEWPAGFEIDIVEQSGPDSGQWAVHYPRTRGASAQHQPVPNRKIVVKGAAARFHFYGALVEGPRAGLRRGRITFYYDGAFAGSAVPALPVPNTGRFLVLACSAGGRGALPRDLYAVFDYVRVWTYRGRPFLVGPRGTAVTAPAHTTG